MEMNEKMLKQIYYDIKELTVFRMKEKKCKKREKGKKESMRKKSFSLFSLSTTEKTGMIAKDNVKQKYEKRNEIFSSREAFFMLGFIFCYISFYDPKTRNDS